MEHADVAPLQRKLGYRFKDSSLLLAAITHPSFRHESTDEQADNQRLEFLGDAVLGMLSANYLYATYPDMAEGDLTHHRSRVTNRSALARLGRQWDVGTYLRLGRGEESSGGRERASNLTDAVEALIGAIYLDGGMRAASRFFERHWLALIESGEKKEHTVENPKGFLQEYCQRTWKISPVYQIIHQDGPPHARQYTAQVQIEDRMWGEGTGSNKRLAEGRAAEATIALMNLGG